jgi:hypothetical protein
VTRVPDAGRVLEGEFSDELKPRHTLHLCLPAVHALRRPLLLPWQGTSGTLYIFGKLFVKLFANLFQRSENIAQAMVVRGFRGPDSHHFHMMTVNPTSAAANAIALAALGALCYAVVQVR